MRLFLVFLCCAFLFLSCDEKKSTVDNDAVTDTAITDTDTAVTDDFTPDNVADEDTLLPDDGACNNAAVEDAFLEQVDNFDAYVAFRAIGVINETDTTTPVAFFQSKFVALLPAHTEITLDQAVGFILEGEQDGAATLEFNILGDPGTLMYGSLTMVILSKDWLIAHKEQLTTDPVVNEAPIMQVMKVTALSNTTVKKCIVAINDGDPEQPDLPAPGKMMVTVCENTDFSVDENLRIGVNAKLTENVDKMLSLLGLSSAAGLCSCADAATNQPVACPGEETPDDDMILTDE